MITKKARCLGVTGAAALIVLISVTSAVMKENVVQKAGATSFSNLGIEEFARTLVKDVPVSGTVIVQHEQTSGDGTIRTVSGKVYRDSEGRTRHDEMGETKGAEASVVEDPLKTTINDPAAGVSFVIDPKTNIARRKRFVAQSEAGSDEVRNAPVVSAPVKQGRLNSQVLPVPNTMEMGQGLKSANTTTSSTNAKRESLGRREIEGMLAEGTRIIMTVPAGSMKNEKQIEIGCERWYSPSLKTLILVECSDSRYGKTTYRLTQIKTDEPSASLFKVPADYKVYE